MTKSKKQTLADLKLENEIHRYKIANARMKNVYDAVNPRTAKQRRASTMERTSEDDHITTIEKRQSINATRNLMRNDTSAVTHSGQIKYNVVGANGGKMLYNSPDKELNKQINNYFNKIWAPESDFIDDTPFQELLANLHSTVITDGGCLVAFDDFYKDNGKLRFWDVDQMVNVKKGDWDDFAKENEITGSTCKNGIVSDEDGVVIGYIVTGAKGQFEVPADKATYLSKQVAKLIKAPWRLNQKEPISSLLPSVNTYQDAYEIKTKELQSMKLNATIAMKVKDNGQMEENFLQAGVDIDDVIEDGGSSTVTGSDRPNYTRYEELTGGYIEYVDERDDVEILDMKRGQNQTTQFLEQTICQAGASRGLGKTYSTLTPAGSYTAFRGDMLLTWAMFTWEQKFLERRFLDWVGRKAIEWAVEKGMLQVSLDEFWYTNIAWEWPTMPDIDPVKAQQAIALALKNGTIDFSKLLGPNWEEKLQQFADQLQYIKSLEIPLSVFEMKSGGTADTDGTNDEQDKQDKQDNEDNE